MAKNKLLFSTPAEGVSLRTGTSRVLTRDHHHHHHHKHGHHHHHHQNPGIDVREYGELRLLATNRGSSATSVIVELTSTSNGQTQIRLARVRLAPGQSYSNTYAVPGRYVNIVAYALRNGRGCRSVDTIDVQLYGRK